MKSNDFQDGHLEYTSGDRDCSFILQEVCRLEDWDNGFLAFANREINIPQADFSLEDVIHLRVNSMSGSLANAEGYLMELNLWRKNGEYWEEIVAEREGTDFFVQQWRLRAAKDISESNCSFRVAQTWIARDQKWPTLEIVCPLERLHFFLSAEEASLPELTGEK